MLLGNIFLMFGWAAFQGGFSLTNLTTGFGVGYLVLAMLARGGVLPSAYGNRAAAILNLVWFLLRDFVTANVRMALDVARSPEHLKPGVLEVPLEARGEYEVLMLTTLINLTPRSIALDLSPDGRYLYVHVMDASDPAAARHAIKHEFERRVLAVMRG